MAIIDKPSDYFNTKLYTGNGGTLVNTGVGFQPDLVWAKSRTQANSHVWFDVVRTFAGNKEIQSNNTGAEGASDSAGYGYISAVSSDGFTAKAGTTAGDYTNVSSQNYVAWNWKAGTSFTNDASSTGIGSIDSAGSFNNDSGFSIVSYTGTGTAGTIKHGLNSVPRMIIVKRRDGSDSWLVQHGSLGAGKALNLDSTGAVQTYDPYWNNTEPTSSVFSVGNDGRTNGSSETYIAYCFSGVQGFSKMGSYTGNANANGPFVYTGFKPAFVMFKNTTGNNWGIIDNKRDSYNGALHRLLPNTSGADNTGAGVVIDFLSNGFKCRNADGLENGAAEIIYMAFAENPFVASNFNAATAR